MSADFGCGVRRLNPETLVVVSVGIHPMNRFSLASVGFPPGFSSGIWLGLSLCGAGSYPGFTAMV